MKASRKRNRPIRTDSKRGFMSCLRLIQRAGRSDSRKICRVFRWRGGVKKMNDAEFESLGLPTEPDEWCSFDPRGE